MRTFLHQRSTSLFPALPVPYCSCRYNRGLLVSKRALPYGAVYDEDEKSGQSPLNLACYQRYVRLSRERRLHEDSF